MYTDKLKEHDALLIGNFLQSIYLREWKIAIEPYTHVVSQHLLQWVYLHGKFIIDQISIMTLP